MSFLFFSIKWEVWGGKAAPFHMDGDDFCSILTPLPLCYRLADWSYSWFRDIKWGLETARSLNLWFSLQNLWSIKHSLSLGGSWSSTEHQLRVQVITYDQQIATCSFQTVLLLFCCLIWSVSYVLSPLILLLLLYLPQTVLKCTTNNMSFSETGHPQDYFRTDLRPEFLPSQILIYG